MNLGSIQKNNKEEKNRRYIVRTYTSDIEEALRKENGSVVKIAIDEQKKKDYLSLEPKKNRFWVIISIVLFVIGLGVIIILLIPKKETGGVLKNTPIIKPIIASEIIKNIDIAGVDKDRIMRFIADELNNNTLRLDVVENINLVENISLGEQPIETSRFLHLIGSRVPPPLLRSLDDYFMIGLYAFDGNNLFVLFKTSSYENTFAGMLDWESEIFGEFYQMFNIDVSGERSELFNKKFKDIFVRNRDARAIIDENGEVVLMYLFINKNTIIITRDENSLLEVITRLGN